MRITPALIAHAQSLLGELLGFAAPADQNVSRYFRAHPRLGQQDRAFIADTVYAVLRQLRTLEHAAGSRAPRALLVAALVRVRGLSLRALEPVLGDSDLALARRVRGADPSTASPAVRAELPDWLWQRLVEAHGEAEASAIAQGLAVPAPLDLRVNLARTGRDAALEALRGAGMQAAPAPWSPCGVRIDGHPAVNRHPLFAQGAIEVQDEGSQLLAYLVAPRRGEMVADYCAGAGGKTLALAMLMRGTGRVYAMDVSSRRLAALGPRAARAGISNVHTLAISGESDARVKRLAGKLDRVLVDAPCSGFGTLRRNPDLKWRHDATAVAELAEKQARILASAARLVKRGGRLVYATCSILDDENERVADRFLAAHPDFGALDCDTLLETQRIVLRPGARLRLWPHRHGTDGFFAAVFERR